MKNIALISLFAIFTVNAYAQGVTSLSENFNADCVVSGAIPTTSGWLEYNPITSTIPWGQWTCTPTLGRPTPTGATTPGIMCADTFDNAYHLDTSFLVTPLLNLSGYTKAYIQFDSKMSNIYVGNKLSVLVVIDSGTYNPTSPTVNLDSTVSPVFGNADTTDWVTDEVDLTNYKNTPFYIAFRYTSSSTAGSVWFLDNINISATRLEVAPISAGVLPLTVIGASTQNNIILSYTIKTSGMYNIALYDMLGRIAYKENINVESGTQGYTIKNLGLHPGMYFVKMGNDSVTGTTKVMIQ